MKTDDVYRDLLARLGAQGYLQGIRRLSDSLGADLWLTGGWVRSAYLRQSSYVGDVDCLVEQRPEEIEERLRYTDIKAFRNIEAGTRVFFPDGNHCDLLSTFE